MVFDLYSEGIPLPFDGTMEGDPEVPERKKRRVYFTGGLMGPIGYPDGTVYPFIMGPVEDYEEEEDPNP